MELMIWLAANDNFIEVKKNSEVWTKKKSFLVKTIVENMITGVNKVLILLFLVAFEVTLSKKVQKPVRYTSWSKFR